MEAEKTVALVDQYTSDEESPRGGVGGKRALRGNPQQKGQNPLHVQGEEKA